MDDKNDKSFWDHLEDLRWMLFRSLIGLVCFTLLAFFLMPHIFDSVVMAPCNGDFFLYSLFCNLSKYTTLLPDFCNEAFHVEVVNIKLTSQFFTHMSLSFWMAFLIVFPYIIYEVWRFICPALYDSEKKGIKWAFMFGTVMFFLGCALGYFMVFPLTLRFLYTYELSDSIIHQLSLDSYMDNFLMLIFIMGLIFELPLLCALFSKLGFLNKSFFSKYRRHAIVALLVAAAFITPSSDPFTLMVVFIPIYFLWEMSAFLVKPAPEEDIEEEELIESEQ